MKRFLASTISNTEIIHGACLLWAKAPEIVTLSQPGQFIMVRCGESFDPLLRRPLSIHQVGSEDRLALFFRVVGKGTAWLSRRREVDCVDCFGPLGRGFSLPSSPANLLLVAGGMGIAPLVFLAQKALSLRHSVTLLLGASSQAQLYPESLLPSGMELVVVATEDGSEGRRGMVTDFLVDFVPRADYVFACGPFSMYQTMAAQKRLRGKSVQVSLEKRMGCGLGVCYGCTIKTARGLKQVCQDGPVFELQDILYSEGGQRGG